MRNPSPPSSSSQCKHICLLVLSLHSTAATIIITACFEQQIAAEEAATAESIDAVCMYVCMHRCRRPRRSFSIRHLLARTHTHALTQPSNARRLIYQSSYVYVRRRRRRRRRKRKRKQAAHTYTNARARTHTSRIYYLKQRFTSVRSSVDDKEQARKERRKTLEMASPLLRIQASVEEREKGET